MFKWLKVPKIIFHVGGVFVLTLGLLGVYFIFNFDASESVKPLSITIKAFPGAEGWGAETIHARNPKSKVLYVTNTNASGKGSLKEAIETSGPRYILFQTGGIIDLSSLPDKELVIKEPYLYIAGQTAPGKGILIKNGSLRIRTHDVVIRYIRFRPGDEIQYGRRAEDLDALTIDGKGTAYNIIIDHCSLSWAIDENVSTWWDAHDVTFQYNIISEALYKTGQHPKGAHSMGVLLGDRSNRISFHHNLLAHNQERNPYVLGSGSEPSTFDVVNNVIYNCGTMCAQGGGKTVWNFVNNYIKEGPSTKLYAPEKPVRIYRNFSGKIFIQGNYYSRLGVSSIKGNNYSLIEDRGKRGEDNIKMKSMIFSPMVKTTPSEILYLTLLENVGASFPVRDSTDSRIIEEVINGTGSIKNHMKTNENFPAGIPYEDSDSDGMSDTWELEKKLNPKDPDDRNGDFSGDGYSNIEKFLNEIIKFAKK